MTETTNENEEATPVVISRKRGKLSTEEENFISASKDHLTVEQIALKLNRTTEPVERFLREKDISPTKEMNADEAFVRQLKAKLRKKAFWNEVNKQLLGDEIEYFENVWIELIKQFNENVTATEELEIKQWITLEILMNRSMKEKKLQLEQVDRLQALLDDEYKVSEEIRDNQKVLMLSQELTFARNSISSYTTDHMKILAQIKEIRRDLKMARADRIKKIEDGKVSFAGLLRLLEDEDTRESEGMEAEVVSRAAIKARLKYSEPHMFANNKLGHPILTPESMLNERQKEIANEQKEEREQIRE